jgi:hypothetical protein
MEYVNGKLVISEDDKQHLTRQLEQRIDLTTLAKALKYGADIPPDAIIFLANILSDIGHGRKSPNEAFNYQQDRKRGRERTPKDELLDYCIVADVEYLHDDKGMTYDEAYIAIGKEYNLSPDTIKTKRKKYPAKG